MLYEKENKNISIYECIKDIPNLYEEKPFLKEIDSMSLGCTLFDENASCHFALENAYSKCVPNFKNMKKEELDKIWFNESQVHVDFMIGTNDLTIEADTIKGKKLIFKNGNFNI